MSRTATASEAAAALGVPVRYLYDVLERGRIVGAEKVGTARGGSWVVPVGEDGKPAILVQRRQGASTCLKCGSSGPFHAGTSPSYCKACMRERAKAYRLLSIEKVREHDRERAKQPDKRAYVRRWQSTHRDAMRRLAGKYPEKQRARQLAKNAIERGILKRAPCQQCGAKKTHAHHEDYSRPLDVMWLCPACHGKRHRKPIEDSKCVASALHSR